MTEAIQMQSAISNLKDVKCCYVVENLTPKVKGDMPTYSIAVFVVGGKKKDIAKTLWKFKPLGIALRGNVVKKVRDSLGHKWEVRFFHIK